VAVISGAGRGIGAATARLIAAEGARVVVWDRDEAPAQAVANEICAAGGEAIPLAGSVASKDDVEAMARRVTDHFGTVHVLVNNAGFAHITEATATTDAQWTDMLSVHMTGAFNCVRALAPLMIRQKYGRIINILRYRCSAPAVWPLTPLRRPGCWASRARSWWSSGRTTSQ
jgi:3-oxoacyl-[acyl-carrier protein] reductase